MSDPTPTSPSPELQLHMKVALMEFTAAGPRDAVQAAFVMYLATVQAAFKASTDVAQGIALAGG